MKRLNKENAEEARELLCWLAFSSGITPVALFHGQREAAGKRRSRNRLVVQIVLLQQLSKVMRFYFLQ